MKLLLLTYFFIILLLSVVRISLLKGKKIQWLALSIPSLLSLAFYNISLQQNNKNLDWLLAQDNLVSGIAILLTFESILVVILTTLQIKSYYNLKSSSLWKWISLIPSFQLIIAFVFLQTLVFLRVDGHSFMLLAAAFFVIGILSLTILTKALQNIIKKWETRAELQALMSLFQLLLAMFLPLIARGQKVRFTQITIDYYSIAFIVALTLSISSIGYFIYKQKNKKQHE